MTEKTTAEGFKKYDVGKLRWDKFCWRGALAVMNIMHHGAEKYDWDNWRKARGEDNERMLQACLRHIISHVMGETIDPESGYSHLWHAACTLLMYIDNHAAELEEKERGGSNVPK